MTDAHVPTPSLRMKFDWTMVDERVLRALLRVEYETGKSRNRLRNLEYIKSMPADEMRMLAAQIYGQGIRPKKLTTPVARVLVDSWLSSLPMKTLNPLAVMLLRPCPLRKRDILERLQSRRLDSTFKANLARSFTSHHKSLQPMGTPPPPPPPPDTQHPEICGKEMAGRSPRRHQLEAHDALDKAMANDRNHVLVVMPTGAGKTFTAVDWLLKRLADEPESRVLWITHRQQLANQAERSFREDAESLPTSFHRKLRVIHAQAGSPAILAKEDNDIVVSTYQSIKPKLLRKFLKRPTYVVIDEAHHAGADKLDKLLAELADHANVQMILGLTATPYPTGIESRVRFNRRFGEPVFTADVAKLTNEGILARSRVAAVGTKTVVKLDPAELKTAEQLGDLQPATLRQLDNDHRNEQIATLCIDNADLFGPTLLFAVDIKHADGLTQLLAERGVDAKALHSQSTEHPANVLSWFERAERGVLVSVGMLNEGVDLPHARTALIARPTASRILMMQMVGRVLRGPKSGGEPDANVIHFRDQFANFSDLLDPAEVLYGPHRFEVKGSERVEHELPDLVDAAGVPIPLGVAAQIGRALNTPEVGANLDDDDPLNDTPLDLRLTFTPVVGYYDLAGALIPVFEHQQQGFKDLAAGVLSGGRLPAALGFFGDGPPPFPSVRTLREFVGLIRAFDEEPTLHALEMRVGEKEVAQRVVDEDMGPAKRGEFVRSYYQQSIDRELLSYEKFTQRVDQAVRDLVDKRKRLDGEILPEDRSDLGRRPRLPYVPDRELAPRFRAVQSFAQATLPPETRAWMTSGLNVDWTRRPAKSHLAYWTISPSGRNRGRRQIRVNCMLQTSAKAVSDQMLEYLLWHELLHDVLPGHGHDAEFRELEALFENAAELDAEWDTLGERFDLDPKRYTQQ